MWENWIWFVKQNCRYTAVQSSVHLVCEGILHDMKGTFAKFFLFPVDLMFPLTLLLKTCRNIWNFSINEKVYSANFFLTRWVPTTSILVVIERIYRYQFKSNYLKNHKCFAAFFFSFRICITFPMLQNKKNKNEPNRSNISEVIDSERCAYLNA